MGASPFMVFSLVSWGGEQNRQLMLARAASASDLSTAPDSPRRGLLGALSGDEWEAGAGPCLYSPSLPRSILGLPCVSPHVAWGRSSGELLIPDSGWLPWWGPWWKLLEKPESLVSAG